MCYTIIYYHIIVHMYITAEQVGPRGLRSESGMHGCFQSIRSGGTTLSIKSYISIAIAMAVTIVITPLSGVHLRLY